jgi:DNA (cytosine-5)-methyltransferase 1
VPRPRLLDLFCGGGGAAMGYHRAGFDVVGVDVVAQPDYPFPFHRGDATTWPLDGFDAIHASPPCQDHTTIRGTARRGLDPAGTAWMLAATIDRLRANGVPVDRRERRLGPLPPRRLRRPNCGGSCFGLDLRRHRLFASNVLLLARPARTTGRHPASRRSTCTATAAGRWPPSSVSTATCTAPATRTPCAALPMGIEWMSPYALTQAIRPPTPSTSEPNCSPPSSTAHEPPVSSQ